MRMNRQDAEGREKKRISQRFDLLLHSSLGVLAVQSPSLQGT
jgi:hypothetical protein